jgi:hypothetical protein
MNFMSKYLSLLLYTYYIFPNSFTTMNLHVVSIRVKGSANYPVLTVAILLTSTLQFCCKWLSTTMPILKKTMFLN